jgi:hypothetical protein
LTLALVVTVAALTVVSMFPVLLVLLKDRQIYMGTEESKQSGAQDCSSRRSKLLARSCPVAKMDFALDKLWRVEGTTKVLRLHYYGPCARVSSRDRN